ncbi:MAG: PEP/pyruvate-binding domain-containing protein [Pseudomonadota bacterium]
MPSVQDVGGKAAALSRLESLGFAPPKFFLIHADSLSELVNGAELTAKLKAIGPGPYAVRSSAVGEDSAQASYAGQFETRLNVSRENVLIAAQNVSASGPGAALYEKARFSEAHTARVHVIVQQMLVPECSGIAFSADPVTGDRTSVVVSAVQGLGDRLVSGEVDGETWTLKHDGTVVSAPELAVLSEGQAREVAALAKRVESAFGEPQDIEWAIEDGRLHILQARPITTPLRPVPNEDQTLLIFDNSNIVESYPGLVSPLTYSFAKYVYARVYRAFVGLLGVPEDQIAENAGVFDNMLGRIDGRVYYNLGNWYRALALLPGFSINRTHMESMMGVSEPLPDELTASIGPAQVTGARKVREMLRVSAVTLQIIGQAVLLPRTRRRFYERLDKALGRGTDLDQANLNELAQEYRVIEAHLLDRWDAPLVNDFLCMIAFGASRSLLKRWLGDEGLKLHNDVMIGQGDIVSAEPPRLIEQIGRMVREAGISAALREQGLDALGDFPKIRNEVDAYIDRFGDRCAEELKLESRSLREDPTPLLTAIAARAERSERVDAEFAKPDWGVFFKGRPFRRLAARALTNWAKLRVRDRENLRYERTRIFGHARRVFLAMGREFHALGKIEEQRDIFFLTVPEILGAIEGSSLSPDLAKQVRLRKAKQTDFAERPDPGERVTMRGSYSAAQSWTAGSPEEVTGDLQRGTGCSTGKVTALARVIRDPRREALAAGEVLVAKHTDPGWIAVFANASAIVVERGSPLSHSAIVARELGIPCVVGLKQATTWIQTGERIEVDGEFGTIRKCDG